MDRNGIRAVTLPALFNAPADGSGDGAGDGDSSLKAALEELCARAAQAIADGYSIIILSDRGRGR